MRGEGGVLLDELRERHVYTPWVGELGERLRVGGVARGDAVGQAVEVHRVRPHVPPTDGVALEDGLHLVQRGLLRVRWR